MAAFVYTRAKTLLPKGLLNLHAGGDDIRVALVGTATTADTEQDAATMSGFTTLDEFTDASYSRKALTNEVVNEDAANDRSEFDADDATWTGLTGDTAQGYVVYKHVTNDADSIPIAYRDFAAPITPGGSDLTIQWNVEGIVQLG